METLGKIRSNFLNKNGFKIGFSNRSPLNQYKSTMPTTFNLPKLNAGKVGIGTRISEGDNAISDAKLKSGEHIGNSIQGVISEIGTTIGKKQEAEKAAKSKEAIIENMPAFVENWQKENPAYDMDDFKAKYGEELNEWMKRNAGAPTGDFDFSRDRLIK